MFNFQVLLLQFVLFVLVIQGGTGVHCLVVMLMMLFTFIAVVVVVMVVVGHFAFVFDLRIASDFRFKQRAEQFMSDKKQADQKRNTTGKR